MHPTVAHKPAVQVLNAKITNKRAQIEQNEIRMKALLEPMLISDVPELMLALQIQPFDLSGAAEMRIYFSCKPLYWGGDMFRVEIALDHEGKFSADFGHASGGWNGTDEGVTTAQQIRCYRDVVAAADRIMTFTTTKGGMLASLLQENVTLQGEKSSLDDECRLLCTGLSVDFYDKQVEDFFDRMKNHYNVTTVTGDNLDAMFKDFVEDSSAMIHGKMSGYKLSAIGLGADAERRFREVKFEMSRTSANAKRFRVNGDSVSRTEAMKYFLGTWLIDGQIVLPADLLRMNTEWRSLIGNDCEIDNLPASFGLIMA
jgi:hypothetical protein